MKRLFIILTALLLTSCIDVQDFGAYWDKTILDPDLAGDWIRLPPASAEGAHDYPAGQKWFFTEKHGAYKIRTHVDGKKDEEPIYPVKSLIVGSYVFMATGEQKNGVFTGDIMRYEIEDNVLTFYMLNFDKAGDYIEKNYPDAENIVRSEAHGHPVTIKHFDDEVFRILSGIPDDNTYWQPDIRLERISN